MWLVHCTYVHTNKPMYPYILYIVKINLIQFSSLHGLFVIKQRLWQVILFLQICSSLVYLFVFCTLVVQYTNSPKTDSFIKSMDLYRYIRFFLIFSGGLYFEYSWHSTLQRCFIVSAFRSYSHSLSFRFIFSPQNLSSLRSANVANKFYSIFDDVFSYYYYLYWMKNNNLLSGKGTPVSIVFVSHSILISECLLLGKSLIPNFNYLHI